MSEPREQILAGIRRSLGRGRLDAAREADRARRVTQFNTALANMKILAEGGTLPPAPARGRGAPASGAAAGREN